MIRLKFKGMMAPNFTPFKNDGSLNLTIIPAYAKFLKEAGVTGVWVSGTAGEGMSMTVAERSEVSRAWLKARPTADFCVIVQCGAGCLRDTLHLAAEAAADGADGVAVLPCLFDPPASTDDLVDYMAEVARVCPRTPLFYYHIPMKTNVQLSMSEFLTKGVARIPNLSGIKFTDGDVAGEGFHCLRVDGGSLTIFNGFDQRLQEALSLGFTSAVNISFNLVPELAGQVFALSAAGRGDEAKKVQQRLTALLDTITRCTDGKFSVAGMKTAGSLLTGLPLGPARLPIKPLTQATRDALRADLAAIPLPVH